MKRWAVSYLDKDGVQQCRDIEWEHRPTHEEAAQKLLPTLYPVVGQFDLNDLEGRAADPTVKTLKDQNSVQIISITESA